jgi:hypothetical protein
MMDESMATLYRDSQQDETRGRMDRGRMFKPPTQLIGAQSLAVPYRPGVGPEGLP